MIVASLEGVNKNYGDVRALRGVDFRRARRRSRGAAGAERRGQDHRGEAAAGTAAAQHRTSRASSAATPRILKTG